ncbi:unnamed protein product [Rhodiola kirilowii]
MGRWNSRWIPNQRSHRHDNRGRFQRELPPPYPAESSENSVPEWEKKFCYVVGSVPWRKVLNTKMFVSCYPDVMNWDDSAAEDTFHTAKRRFWTQINGLPTDDVPLPDPNAYIDQIDWNACIDTSLFMDVERALLSADVCTKGETEVGRTGVVDISALTQNSKWQEWNQGTADDVLESGACWDKSNDGGWGKPDNNGGWGTVNAVTDEPKFAKGSDWDFGATKTNGPVKNIAWGYCSDKSWGRNQPEYFYSTMNPHNAANNDRNFQGHRTPKNNRWAVSGNNSWGRNHQPNNFRETQAWGHCSLQHNGASTAREWGKHGDNPQCHNSWNNNQPKKNDTYYKSSENQYWGNRGDRKRESPNNYAPKSKSPRFQHTDNQRHEQHEAVKPWRNGQVMQRAGSSFRPS